MDSPLGPDGLPAVYDGGAWQSSDRRFWWNGAEWMPTQTTTAPVAPWLVKGGVALLLLALLGYAVYTTVTTQSEFALGYDVGVILFFGLLVVIFRFAGRWGWIGVVIRAACGFLAVLKILTLIVHPPPT